MFCYSTIQLWHPQFIIPTMNCHHWTSFQDTQVKFLALSLIYISTHQWFSIQLSSFRFPMNMIFSFPSYVLRDNPIPYFQCLHTYMHLHILLFILWMWEEIVNYFPSAWKKLKLIVLLTYVHALCTYMYIYVDARVIVFTHSYHACLYVYTILTQQLFLRLPNFHFIYVNTSVDFECCCALLNLSVLKRNVYSQCL